MARYLVMWHPGDAVPDRMKYVDDATGPPDANDDAATLGVTVGSLWIDTTTPAVYACADATTAAAVWVELSGGANTHLAAVAPTVNDDSGDGYAAGWHWIDTVASRVWVCRDASVGAAVWLEVLVTFEGTAFLRLEHDDPFAYPGITIQRARTGGDAVEDGDYLGGSDYYGWDGDSYEWAGGNYLYVDGTVTDGYVPAKFHLSNMEGGFGLSGDGSLFLYEIAADGGTPGAGQWAIYAKSGGIYVRDDAGAVVGPLGAAAAGHYELLMTGASPPEPLEDGTGTDWLWVWVAD